MTDPRPSENTDDRRDWFGDLPTSIFALTRTDQYPIRPDGELDPIVDPVADMIEKAENAHDPEHGLVFAQLATVQQLRKLTAVAEAAVESVRALLAEGADR